MANGGAENSEPPTKAEAARKRTREEEEAEQKEIDKYKTSAKEDESEDAEPNAEKDKDGSQHITKKSKVPHSEENSIEDKAQEEVSKEENNEESNSSNDGSKHVFGSSSLKPPEAVKDQQNEKPASGSSTPKSGFVFGAKSAFTSKYKSSLNKPGENPWSSGTSSKADTPSDTKSSASNNPWASSEDKSEEKENGSSAATKELKESKDGSPSQETPENETEDKVKASGEKKDEPYAQITVPLEAKKVETGEEDEESIFSCRAKLYVMDLSAADKDKGWKERGIGNVHVNRPKTDKGIQRIVMRADGVLKVIANLPLARGLSATAGMKSSLASDKFVRVSVVENKRPMQYAFKMGNPETATKFYESVTKLIPEDENTPSPTTEQDKSSSNNDSKKQ